MTREELINSREYWITKIQLDLFNQIEKYMVEHQLSRTQLAEKLGVTKGYVSQILNGDFDHKISKLVDLSLVIGKAPEVNYVDLHKFLMKDNDTIDSPSYVFKSIIRGNPIQKQPFSNNDSQDLEQLIA